jgi:hypothetical protein
MLITEKTSSTKKSTEKKLTITNNATETKKNQNILQGKKIWQITNDATKNK